METGLLRSISARFTASDRCAIEVDGDYKTEIFDKFGVGKL